MYEEDEQGPARTCAGCNRRVDDTAYWPKKQEFCGACNRRIPSDIRKRIAWAANESDVELEAAVREALVALGVMT